MYTCLLNYMYFFYLHVWTLVECAVYACVFVQEHTVTCRTTVKKKSTDWEELCPSHQVSVFVAKTSIQSKDMDPDSGDDKARVGGFARFHFFS